jgi:hypothetical protein
MSLRAALPWHRPPGQVWRSNLPLNGKILSKGAHRLSGDCFSRGEHAPSQRHAKVGRKELFLMTITEKQILLWLDENKSEILLSNVACGHIHNPHISTLSNFSHCHLTAADVTTIIDPAKKSPAANWRDLTSEISQKHPIDGMENKMLTIQRPVIGICCGSKEACELCSPLT